jgi:hypothetical protein
MEHECKGGLYRRELVGGRQGKWEGTWGWTGSKNVAHMKIV